MRNLLTGRGSLTFLLLSSSAAIAKMQSRKISQRSSQLPIIHKVELSEDLKKDFRHFSREIVARESSIIEIPFKASIINDLSLFLKQYFEHSKIMIDQHLKDSIAAFAEDHMAILHISNMANHRDFTSVSFSERNIEYVRDFYPRSFFSRNFQEIILLNAISSLCNFKPYEIAGDVSYVSVSPLFMIHDTYTQMPHCDDVKIVGQNSKKVDAFSIYSIKGNGGVKTYAISAFEVFSSISLKSQTILQKPIFYFTGESYFSGVDIDKKALRKEDLFSIFSVDSKSGNIEISYDANYPEYFDFVDDEQYSRDEIKQSLSEIYANVVIKFSERNFAEVGLRDGEGWISRHSNFLHGRREDAHNIDPTRKAIGLLFEKKEPIRSPVVVKEFSCFGDGSKVR